MGQGIVNPIILRDVHKVREHLANLDFDQRFVIVFLVLAQCEGFICVLLYHLSKAFHFLKQRIVDDF